MNLDTVLPVRCQYWNVIVAGVGLLISCKEPSVFDGLAGDAGFSEMVGGVQAGGASGSAGGGAGGDVGASTDAGPGLSVDAEVGGVGGQGGVSNTGGSNAGGAGGTVPDCVAKTEDCFNQIDDDCDRQVDCADPDCGAAAMCVPKVSADFALGVRVAADAACPPGYTEDKIVRRGLRSSNDCAGCLCTVSPTKCKAEVLFFSKATDCTADAGGTYSTEADGNYGSCDLLINGGGAIYGAKLNGAYASATCSVKDTAAPQPAEWAESGKFCKRNGLAFGGGCATDKICVVKAAAPVCVLKAGNATCPASFSADASGFTSSTDTRVCSACNCAVKGGACPAPAVSVYYGYNCANNPEFTLTSAAPKKCQSVGYGTVARYTGTIESASCIGTATVTSGGLTPTGPMTLCCSP